MSCPTWIRCLCELIFPSLRLLRKAVDAKGGHQSVSSNFSIQVAQETALKARPFAVHQLTFIVMASFAYEFVIHETFKDFCEAHYIDELRIRSVFWSRPWEEWPLAYFSGAALFWVAIGHLYVYYSICLRPGLPRAILTLENTALLCFMVADFATDVTWYCLRRRFDKFVVCYLIYKFIYLCNANVILAATTSFQVVPKHSSRVQVMLCWLCWLCHGIYTVAGIIMFLQCSNSFGRLLADHFGASVATIMLGMAHFSETHRLLMIIGVFAGVHVQACPHDPPNIMHFIEALQTPRRAGFAFLFVGALFVMAIVCERSDFQFDSPKGQDILGSWDIAFGILFSALEVLAGYTYLSQIYMSTEVSWETVLVLISAATATFHYSKLWEGDEFVAVVETGGFWITASFASDVFSSRVKLSAVGSLLPLFIALAMLVKSTSEEFAELSESLQGHQPNHRRLTGAHGNESPVAHLIMEAANFMLNEFALISVIGWLANFLEESDSTEHERSYHGGAGVRVDSDSFASWLEKRRSQTSFLREKHIQSRRFVNGPEVCAAQRMSAIQSRRDQLGTSGAASGFFSMEMPIHSTFRVEEETEPPT